MPQNHSALVKLLEKRSKKCPLDFPRGASVNYYERFRGIERYLNQEIHPHTAAGAMARQMGDVKRVADGGATPEQVAAMIIENSAWLTDHGPEHVSTVIDRASAMIFDSKAQLSSYEIYLLLVAIHFHDVGNIYGRDEHETRISEVMRAMEIAIIGDDSSEKRLIRDIAAAHGGKVEEDPDTIGRLPRSSAHSKPLVRIQLLAAILRFADELADDFTRAARFPLKEALIGDASAIFHVYSDRLRNVTVDEGVISLQFELDTSHVLQEFGKGSRRVYLLDEIYTRTMKMHLEHIYCTRFMRSELHINRIAVNIGIYKEQFMTEVFRIAYVLEEKGYPSAPTDIHLIAAPKPVVPSSGQPLTGESLRNYIASI